MPDADVRQPRRVIGPDGDIAGDVGHVVVNAVVPSQRRDRPHITETGDRVADAVGARERKCAERCCQRDCDHPR
jgi:hypothetical protein